MDALARMFELGAVLASGGHSHQCPKCGWSGVSNHDTCPECDAFLSSDSISKPKETGEILGQLALNPKTGEVICTPYKK